MYLISCIFANTIRISVLIIIKRLNIGNSYRSFDGLQIYQKDTKKGKCPEKYYDSDVWQSRIYDYKCTGREGTGRIYPTKSDQTNEKQIIFLKKS